MPVRLNTFVPMQEVTSAFMNGFQDHTYEQRGDGAGNTHPVGMDTQINANRRRVVVAQDSAPTTPPLMGGMVDSGADYRDRMLTFDLKLHTTRDIRPTGADRNVQAEYHYQGTIYVSISGGNISLQRPGILAVYAMELYVDPLTGALGIKKPPGYLWGTVSISTNLKVP